MICRATSPSRSSNDFSPTVVEFLGGMPLLGNRTYAQVAMAWTDLTYDEVRSRNLRVMDPTAIAHCMEHNMPILVFNFRKDGNILRAVRGEKVGTRIGSKPPQ